MDNRPIGVFDSGLGGLTVLKEIRKILPDESIVYFGDCGRAPYGVKSPETIRRYTYQNTRFFLETGVKLLVIACNSSSAHAYRPVADALEFPVVEVIRPGSATAARATKNRKIGVIGTTATIVSRVYEDVIYGIDPRIEVFVKACPLFVPLAEEGPDWWSHEATHAIAAEYLGGLRGTGIDCLVLGCTHYPLLGGVIKSAVGDGIELISSAQAVAAEVLNTLETMGIRRSAGNSNSFNEPSRSSSEPKGSLNELPDIKFYTSDSPEKFEPLCGAILGEPANERVYRLDIEQYESMLP